VNSSSSPTNVVVRWADRLPRGRIGYCSNAMLLWGNMILCTNIMISYPQNYFMYNNHDVTCNNIQQFVIIVNINVFIVYVY